MSCAFDCLRPVLLVIMFGGLVLNLPGQVRSAQPSEAIVDFEPNLPMVFLEAKEPINAEPRVPCNIRMTYPKGAPAGPTGPWSGNVRIHGRLSQGFAKKSFAIGLGESVPLLGMGRHANWLLNASYIDQSLMRHKLAFDLFRSLSTPSVPRLATASRFVEVYFNGGYHGVYLLMERMDKDWLGLPPFRSNEVTHACVYKAIDHGANFASPGNGGYEQKEPDPTLLSYWKPLLDFNRFVSSTSPLAFFAATNGLESRLDVNQAIDFHLLVLLTANWDGITKNFYLARGSKNDPKGRFFFVPWDYDGTFGRNWDGGRFSGHEWLSNHLFDRLLSNPEYRARYLARWQQLRQREFSSRPSRA